MGGIVVGVDGSEASKAALRFALEEARLRQSSLRVIYAWKHAVGGLYTHPTGAPGRRPPSPPKSRAQKEQEWLRGFVRTVVPRADVEMTESAVEGDPVPALLEAAKEAELLVVGSRGQGGFAGLLLGSVSQQCAQHAPCPVVIVRRRHRTMRRPVAADRERG
jgi:nucleotide-binding universal stress UspA family protein